MVVYADDVSLDRPILGTQITNNPLDGAVFGKDASGNTDLMYVGSNGFPSKLVVYDARTVSWWMIRISIRRKLSGE